MNLEILYLTCCISLGGWHQQGQYSTTSITFNKALEVAQGLETAEKNAHDLKIQSDSSVNKMHGNKRHDEVRQTWKERQSSSTCSTKTTTYNKCMRCGDTRHRSQDCFHKKTVCNFCKKIGHLERVCITKTTRKQRGGEHRSYFVDETEATMERSTTPSSERSTASQEYALCYNRSTLPHEPLTVDVNISQASVKMEIDTGGTFTLMSAH